MKTLLLGGTGAIGKALVENVSKNNIEVHVTSRRNIKSSQNIKYIQGNAHDIKFLKRVINKKEYDVIVDFMVYEYEEFKNRIDLLLNNTKQYIFLSSARVYSNEEKGINEKTKRLLETCKNHKFLDSKNYAIEKAKEENLLINNKKKNWTIVRPYITYNDNRLQLGVYEKEQWLYRILKDKSIFIQEKLLNTKTTMTYACDVSKYISKLMLNEKAYGEIFQVAENHSDITWKDILKIYQKVLEKNKIKMNVKITESEKYDTRLTMYYSLIYDRYYNRVFNSNKLEKAIGEKVKYTNIETGLSKCLEKQLNNVKIKDIQFEPVYTGVVDKITKTQTSLKEFKSTKNKIRYILARYTPYYNFKITH